MTDINPETPPGNGEQPPKKGFLDYTQGLWWPAYALLLTPFIIVAGFLYRTVKDEVNLKAAFATVAVFTLLAFPHEWYALQRGWWIYNNARMLGPKMFGVVPIDELLYYVFPALVEIVGVHVIRKWLAKRGNS